jgi:hypothetical protein
MMEEKTLQLPEEKAQTDSEVAEKTSATSPACPEPPGHRAPAERVRQDPRHGQRPPSLWQPIRRENRLENGKLVVCPSVATHVNRDPRRVHPRLR